MGDNGKLQTAQHIDPLNPPKDFVILSIIQYKDAKGNIIQDVQSHLMKDLRNEAFIMAMMDSAKAQLANWFKEQKAINRFGDRIIKK
jgi:hypothetical protein